MLWRGRNKFDESYFPDSHRSQISSLCKITSQGYDTMTRIGGNILVSSQHQNLTRMHFRYFSLYYFIFLKIANKLTPCQLLFTFQYLTKLHNRNTTQSILKCTIKCRKFCYILSKIFFDFYLYTILIFSSSNF